MTISVNSQTNFSGSFVANRPSSATIHPQSFGMEKSNLFGSMEIPTMERRLPQEADMQQKVEYILREWINICYAPITQRDPQQALGMIVRMVSNVGKFSLIRTIFRCTNKGFCLQVRDFVESIFKQIFYENYEKK